MKLFSNVLKRTRQASAKNLFLSFALLLALSVGGVMGVNTIGQDGQVDAATSSCGDDSSNSIIRNGASSRSSFISKVKASSELQKIYAKMGLSASDYSRFVSDAKPGVAYNNNTIVVGGNVVATNVGSTGRLKGCQGSGARTFPVSGVGNIYGNLNSKAFAAGTKSLPVDVLFNSKGQVQFAVMTGDCGNPTYQTPVTPTYACHSLQTKSLGDNSYSFTTDADAGHGAKITKLVYNFGDGSKTVTETNPNTAVRHTFTKSATVTVSVYISLPGGGSVVLTNCKHAITFTPPPAVFACNLLTLTPGTVDKTTGNQSYTLGVQASAKNASIKSYTFTFGDGKSDTLQTNVGSIRVTHTYAPGTWTAKVTMTVLTNTGVTKTVGGTGNCAKPLTVKPLVSTLACVALKPTAGSIDQHTGNQQYSFAATASANNATITSYTFTIDGAVQAPVTTSATTASATHTFAPGSHTVSVSVTGKDAAGKTITAVASPNCATSFTVKTLECKPGVPVNSPECKSTLTCVSLTATPGAIDSTGNQTYSFTTQATANNATITDYGYTFDGKNVVNSNSPTTSMSFAPGTHTATVVVAGKDANGGTIQAPANVKCSVSFTVPTPKTPSVTITKTVDGKKTEVVQLNTNYEYEVTVTNNGQVDLTNAVVTDLPEDGVVLVSENENLGTITNNQWTYTIPALAQGQSMTFKFTAQLTKSSTDPVDNEACVSDTAVNDNQPVCDHATVTTTPPAQTLVNTGAGNIAGIFGAAVVVGTLGYRLFLGRRLSRQS